MKTQLLNQLPQAKLPSVQSAAQLANVQLEKLPTFSALHQSTDSESIQFGANYKERMLAEVKSDMTDRQLANVINRAYGTKDTELIQKVIEHPDLSATQHRKAVRYLEFFHKGLPEVLKGINKDNPEPLLKYMPLILFAMPQKVVDDIGHSLDFEKPMLTGFVNKSHRSEAEALLLLRHPDLLDRKQSSISKLMQGITSIHIFTQRVSDTIAKAWQDIGLLTHSFRFWRFDAEGGPDSLLSKFGFESIQDTSDNPFGRGYTFDAARSIHTQVDREMNLDTNVTFRRGFLMATHPENGTLIVRNSSKVFGRDLMEAPAYFSPRVFSPEQMALFTPTKDNLKNQEFTNILSPKLYGQPLSTVMDFKGILSLLSPIMESTNADKATKDAAAKKTFGNVVGKVSFKSFDKNILFLSEELLKLKKEYAHWKFNNKGFLINPETMDNRFTLEESPGFKALVKDFKRRLAEDKPLPDLAFTHPEYPPFEPYARLSMNQERLEQLDKLLEDDWAVDRELIDFIQTGVSKHAELVMLKADDKLDSL